MTHRYIKIGATALVLVLAFAGMLWSTLREGTEYYKNLDEVPEFKGKNTTTEFLTKYIFDRLAHHAREGDLGRPGRELRAIRVSIAESHVARASYEAPLW